MGGSGTDATARITHSQQVAPTPGSWRRQKMQTLLHFFWERVEQGRFLPGDAVTLAAQGSGVAFAVFLATLSQGSDDLSLA